jgi:hypothetical protein
MIASAQLPRKIRKTGRSRAKSEAGTNPAGCFEAAVPSPVSALSSATSDVVSLAEEDASFRANDGAIERL